MNLNPPNGHGLDALIKLDACIGLLNEAVMAAACDRSFFPTKDWGALNRKLKALQATQNKISKRLKRAVRTAPLTSDL